MLNVIICFVINLKTMGELKISRFQFQGPDLTVSDLGRFRVRQYSFRVLQSCDRVFFVYLNLMFLIFFFFFINHEKLELNHQASFNICLQSHSYGEIRRKGTYKIALERLSYFNLCTLISSLLFCFVLPDFQHCSFDLSAKESNPFQQFDSHLAVTGY